MGTWHIGLILFSSNRAFLPLLAPIPGGTDKGSDRHRVAGTTPGLTLKPVSPCPEDAFWVWKGWLGMAGCAREPHAQSIKRLFSLPVSSLIKPGLRQQSSGEERLPCRAEPWDRQAELWVQTGPIEGEGSLVC